MSDNTKCLQECWWKCKLTPFSEEQFNTFIRILNRHVFVPAVALPEIQPTDILGKLYQCVSSRMFIRSLFGGTDRKKKKKILEIFFMKMSKAHNTYVDTYAQICQGGIWCQVGEVEHTREP